MHKIKILLLSLVLIILVFVSMLAFTLSSYTNEGFKQVVINAVEKLSDYRLTIEGPFELDRSFSPKLSVSGIKLQCKTCPDHIHIDHFRIQLTLAPLLNNTLLINDLLLENVHAEITKTDETTDSTGLFDHLPVPIIVHAVVKNIQLIINNDKQYRLDNLLIAENDRQDQLEVQTTGKIQGRKFNLKGTLSLLSDNNELLEFSPDTIANLISGKQTKAKYKGEISVGKTKINSDLFLSFTNDKPDISGDINTVNLFLNDFGFLSGKSNNTSQPVQDATVKTPLFSHKPLPFQVLHFVDLNLQIKIHRLRAKNYTLDKIKINLLSKNGKFTADPVSFNFSGERVLMTARIDAQAKPEWVFVIDSKNIQVAKILRQQQSSQPNTGKLSVVAQLKGTGASVHKIVSSLQGEVSIVLENETITRSELEVVFLNPMGWIFSKGFSANEFQISCGLARYEIKQGIIRSKILLIDGPKLLIRGNEEINLANETINSLYNMQKKNVFETHMLPSFFTSSVPIRVSGDLANPTVEQAPLDSIEAKVDRYIFAPVVTIPQEVFGTMLDILDDKKSVHNPCKKFTKN